MAINLLKSTLIKTSHNCKIKSVGQKRSVKNHALIKEKVQKKPFLGIKYPKKQEILKPSGVLGTPAVATPTSNKAAEL